jgi:hydroxyacyl-ACP dehydratase HTD2-like protein with hotdog domain
MLDYWRDHCAGTAGASEVREISYRAMAPIYVGETYTVEGKETETGVKEEGEGDRGGSRWEVLVMKEGKICMRGDILGVVSDSEKGR